jgi:hypothetical protein
VLVTENVIHVGTVAAQLSGKPRSGALLPLKFFVYGVSYMHKKSGITCFLPIATESIAKHFYHQQAQAIHAILRELSHLFSWYILAILRSKNKLIVHFLFFNISFLFTFLFVCGQTYAFC